MAKKAEKTVEEQIEDSLEINRFQGYEAIERLPTGILALDSVTYGGLGVGVVSTISGNPGTGKTTTCAAIGAHTQENDGLVAWVDMEQKTEPQSLKMMGMDISKKWLYFARPKNGDDCLNLCRDLLRSRQFKYIVLDSAMAIASASSTDSDSADKTMMMLASMLSQWFNKMTHNISTSGAAFMITNQIRTGTGPNGSYEIEPGGKALGFYPFLKIKTQAIDITKDRLFRKEGNKSIPTQTCYHGRITKHNGGPIDVEYDWWCSYDGLTGVDVAMDALLEGIAHNLIVGDDGEPLVGNFGLRKMFLNGIDLGGGGKNAVAARLEASPALLAQVIAAVRIDIKADRLRSERLAEMR